MCIALKNAILASEILAMSDCGITADSSKTMLSDAVLKVRQELLSEEQRLFSSLERKNCQKIHDITEQISILRRSFEAEEEARAL